MSTPHCPAPRQLVERRTYTVHSTVAQPRVEGSGSDVDALAKEVQRAIGRARSSLGDIGLVKQRMAQAEAGLAALVTAIREDAEHLGDLLHAEQQAHERTRAALAVRTYEYEEMQRAKEAKALRIWELLAVATAARAVLAVCDMPTTLEQQEGRMQELAVALATLRTALGEDAQSPATQAPPEAFTRSHALEPDMPGLPEGSR